MIHLLTVMISFFYIELLDWIILEFRYGIHNKIIIEYDMLQLNQEEIRLSIDMATKLDDDGNYPVIVENGRIISLDGRSDRDNDNLSLVGTKVVKETIKPIHK